MTRPQVFEVDIVQLVRVMPDHEIIVSPAPAPIPFGGACSKGEDESHLSFIGGLQDSFSPPSHSLIVNWRNNDDSSWYFLPFSDF